MTEEPGQAVADSLFRRILRNAGLVLGGKLVTALLNLAAFGIGMHSLGAERMGVLVLVHGFAQTASSLVKFQSWQAVLRYGAGSLGEERRAEFHALLRFTAGLDIGSGVLGAILCAGAALLLGPSFGWPPEVLPLAALYATSTLFLVTATPTGLLRLLDRFDLLARRDAAGAAIRLGGAALAAGLGAGLPGFLGAWYAGTALGGVVLVATAWREVARRGLLRPDPAGRRVRAARVHPGIWGFTWSTNLMTTLSLGSSHVATLCVGWTIGPVGAALFSLARQIGEAALKPSRFLTPALYPELARLLAEGNHDALRRLLRRGLRLSAALALGLLLLLAAIGGPLLRLVGGPEGGEAYRLMLLLAAATSIGFAGFALEPLLVSAGRHGLALRLRALSTAAYVPLALIGLRLVGLEGAGIAALLSALLLLAGQAVPALRWVASPASGARDQNLRYSSGKHLTGDARGGMGVGNRGTGDAG
ncbi:lipopolysaccharide biosynthesis protein [Muricoccus pecuniae]|uniref:O-antigen/teichoic acid export membrane protein n=1 Tax=Muricoccus pecuniae TaxID=693023 RepID=A0A840Y5L4_9PROT|nr:lipopolysaccharide biosynthesis protein [Roseomonas pecuniae]MBB5694069.1 O-antigen/teichoic acid export membrane protein [Roseomonas pecuniae]